MNAAAPGKGWVMPRSVAAAVPLLPSGAGGSAAAPGRWSWGLSACVSKGTKCRYLKEEQNPLFCRLKFVMMENLVGKRI